MKAFRSTLEDLEDRRSVASAQSCHSLRSSRSLGHRPLSTTELYFIDDTKSPSETPYELGAFTGSRHLLPDIPEVERIPLVEQGASVKRGGAPALVVNNSVAPANVLNTTATGNPHPAHSHSSAASAVRIGKSMSLDVPPSSRAPQNFF